MANKKLEPLFWINPNFRLQFPYFSIKWYKIDHQVLLQATYDTICSLEK